MIVASSNTIEGHRVQTIGMVSGNIVISKNSGHDFLTSVKNFLGTQNTLLADATELARREARRRMAEEADTLGADADVCGSPRDERSHRERRGRLARVSVQRVALYAELEKVGVEQDTRAASPFSVDQPHARAGQVLEMP